MKSIVDYSPSLDRMTAPRHLPLLWTGSASAQSPSTPQAESGTLVQHFASAFENAVIGMALLATDHRALTVNRALCEFLGYTEAEMLAQGVHDVVHPDDVEEDRQQLALLRAGKKDSHRREKRYVHKLGHILWGDFSCTLVRDQDALPLFLITQVQDVTERKQAEQAWRESEERFRRLMDLSSDWY